MEVTTPLINGAAKGAYNTISRLSGSPLKAEDIEASQKASFSEMVADAAKDAAETVRASDQAIQAGIQGKLGVQEVIQATMAAETTVQMVVGMRDKLVQAYQEVLRMPI